MRHSFLLLLPLSAMLLWGCQGASQDDDDSTEPLPPYQATLRTTSYGIPHILAEDLGSAAFGQGYVFARDHICVLADQIVKVRGQRARYFGAGEDDEHVNSDFGYHASRVRMYAEEGFPHLSPDVQDELNGFAAGYNHLLEQKGLEGLPPDCAGQEWVTSITGADLLSYYLDVALYASGRQVIPYMATAVAPGDESEVRARPAQVPNLQTLPIGSNAWGIGADRAEGGRGMLVANPHFPWEGELKLYESHVTVPGRVNVYGAGLMGVVGTLIGFNEAVAWSHTVSYAPRFTLYIHTLGQEPTRYIYDGEELEMEPSTYTVEVLEEDGSLTSRTRTLYRTRFGPVLDLSVAGVPWTGAIAFSFRDANEDNLALIEQFLRMNTATSMDEFQAVHQDVRGIPWVHTTSTSAEGRAWYTDSSSVPRLSDEALAIWNELRETDYLTANFDALGFVLLDGSDSLFDWVVDPQDAGGSRGLIPWDEVPQLERSDFVMNANDNHWLPNPASPLEGYNLLYDEERTPRSARTRMNLMILTETGDDAASGADGRFSLDELSGAVFSQRALVSELLKEAVVARCQETPEVEVGEETRDLTDACQALADWDGLLFTESAGAVLWREFVGNYVYEDIEDGGILFAVPFDPNDPVGTPNTLVPPPAEGPDPVLVSLAYAASMLEGQGIPLDASMGDLQFTLKDQQRISIPGGINREGATNIVGYSDGSNGTLYPSMPRDTVVSSRTGLTTSGYPVNNGSSFVMAMEFTDSGPRARAVLTYSQASSNPDSPHFADQTLLFSDSQWRDVLFTEEQIAADPNLTVEEITAPRE